MTTSVLHLERTAEDKLPSTTDFGGYPLVYYTDRGEMLCADCATEDLDTWSDADWRGPNRYSWQNYDGPQWADVLWEGIEFCEQCGTGVRGAYEPDED